MRLSLGAKLYIGSVTVLAAVVVGSVLPQFLQNLDNSRLIYAAIIFATLAFLTQLYEVKLPYNRRTSTAKAISLAAILFGGAPLAIAVNLAGTLIAEIILRWRELAEGFLVFLLRVSFNISQVILATYVGAWIFGSVLNGRSLVTVPHVGQLSEAELFYGAVIPSIGAFACYELANNALVAGIITLTQQVSPAYHLKFNLKHLPVHILSLGILGILMAEIYALSPWYLLLILVPLGLVHISLRNYMKLRYQAQKTFERVSHLLSDRDPYTYEHSSQVADLAEQIAHKLKLNQDQIEQIRSAAVIHDIGKLGVPDRILQKPGPLTEEEWVIMKKHPEIGADLLTDLEIDAYIINVVRHEHERWDGSGYPKGLKGEEIPIGARIVAVADVYSALTTDRPYRPAYSQDIALNMLRDMSEVKLDAQVVDALFGVLEDASAQPVHTPTKVGVL